MFSAKFKLGQIIDKEGTTCTEEQLLLEIHARVDRLETLGIGPHDRVLICHGGTHEFFADLFAIWWVGACAVCINPKSSLYELAGIAGVLSPKLVLIDKGRELAALDVVGPMVSFVGIAADSCSPTSRSPHPFIPENEALILFTSGTTGDPKGVVHSYQSVSNRIATNRKYIGDKIFQRTLCLLPTHFGHGLIGNCLTPLFAGGDLFLRPLASIDDFASIGQRIDRHQITFLSSVPSMWRVILKVSKGPVANTLRQVNIGSEQLSAQLWREVMKWTGIENVISVYGITETANWIGGMSARERSPEDGLVGRVWDGHAAVRSESGAITTSGTGEILVKTPSLMRGYLNRPHDTSKVMVEGFFATGDLGVVDASGVIRITGRQKLEINRGGIKVSPEEVEALIESSDFIDEACVFGIPHDISGETVAAVLVLRDGLVGDGSSDAEKILRDLETYLRVRIAPEKIPEKWYIRDAIPKTERGKKDRAWVNSRCL